MNEDLDKLTKEEEAELVFKYRLCLALGVLSPDHLDAILSQRQQDGWAWYAAREPFGFAAQNLLMARQVWASLQPYSKRKLKEKDFALVVKPRRAPLTADEWKARGKAIATALGGVIRKR